MIERVTKQDITQGADRRQFLRRSAIAAGGAAVATTAFVASPASAQAPTVGYVPLAEPYRTYDSRNDPDGPILPGETYQIDMSGIPNEAIAATINLAAINTDVWGQDAYLTAYGQGISRPGVSTLNFWSSNQFLANMVTIATGEPDNGISVYCGGDGATHFLVDVYGYYA